MGSQVLPHDPPIGILLAPKADILRSMKGIRQGTAEHLAAAFIRHLRQCVKLYPSDQRNPFPLRMSTGILSLQRLTIFRQAYSVPSISALHQ